MELDALFSQYDNAKKYEIFVEATPKESYLAFKQTDFSESRIIQTLFFIRGGLSQINLNQLLNRLILLYEKAPDEIIYGVVGTPWNWTAGPLDMSPQQFFDFQKRGYAKVAWNFSFKGIPNGGTQISTETRILCTDKLSKFKFRLYWTLIGPFSGMIRKEMLRLIKENLRAQKMNLMK